MLRRVLAGADNTVVRPLPEIATSTRNKEATAFDIYQAAPLHASSDLSLLESSINLQALLLQPLTVRRPPWATFRAMVDRLRLQASPNRRQPRGADFRILRLAAVLAIGTVPCAHVPIPAARDTSRARIGTR